MWRQTLIMTSSMLLASSPLSWQIVGAAAEKDHTKSLSLSSATTSVSKRALSSSSSSSSSSGSTIPCSLPCNNGGVCVLKPSKNLPFVSNIVQSNQSSSSSSSGSSSGTMEESCDCSKTNYLGALCDIRIQPCPLTTMVVCLYGQICVQDETGFHCACDPSVQNSDGTSSSSSSSTACQRHRTQMCNMAGVGLPPGRIGAFYCVNDGTCDGQGGCHCPYGYYGPHCEFIGSEGTHLSSSSSSSALENNGSASGRGEGNVAFVAAMVVVAVVLALVAAVLGRRFYHQRQEAARERHIVERTLLNSTSSTSSNTSGPFDRKNNNNNNLLIDLGPQRDFDGNELEEVEII